MTIDRSRLAVVFALGLSFWMVSKFWIVAYSADRSPYECPGGKSYPVHLTFDDGPHLTNTPKVLKILSEKKVPGTFFVLGEHLSELNPARKKYYAVLNQIKAQGHVIASHSFSHVRHKDLSEEKTKKYFEQSRWVLREYLSHPAYIRLPYGSGWYGTRGDAKDQEESRSVMEQSQNAGFVHVGWDIDTNDWDPKKRERLVESMMNQICQRKGGIILLHDVQRYTADHLATWIDLIRGAGHRLVDLEDIQRFKATSAVGNRVYLTGGSPAKKKDRHSCPDCPKPAAQESEVDRLHRAVQDGVKESERTQKRKKP